MVTELQTRPVVSLRWLLGLGALALLSGCGGSPTGQDGGTGDAGPLVPRHQAVEVASLPPLAGSLIADETTAFLGTNGSLVRVDLGDGGVTTVRAGASRSLVDDGARIFFLAYHPFSINKDGSDERRLFTAGAGGNPDGLKSLVVDATDIYLLSRNASDFCAIHRLPRTGTTGVTPLRVSLAPCDLQPKLQTDGTFFYWTGNTPGAGAGRVYRTAKGSMPVGVAEVTAVNPGADAAFAVNATGTLVAAEGLDVYRVSLQDLTQRTLLWNGLARGTGQTRALALSGTTVFGGSDKAVWRIELDGSNPALLATGDDLAVQELAVTASEVLFVSKATPSHANRLMRVPRD
jgi:hypothetical protein